MPPFTVVHCRFSRPVLGLYILAFSLVMAIMLNASPAQVAHAAGVISTCDENSLIQAVAAGGSYTFSCSGTITLNSTPTSGLNVGSDLTLDATGQSVILNGANTHRFFLVNSSKKLTLKNLTLTNGFAGAGTSTAGAIYTQPGTTVTLVNCTLSNNKAGVNGGAIDNQGVLVSINSNFSNNSLDQNSPYSTDGGAINSNGNQTSLTIIGGTFSGNQGATGGAIAGSGATISITGASFTSNVATNGYGGGAINTAVSGPLFISGVTFSGNSATNQNGGAIYNGGGPLSIYNSAFSQNTTGANKWGGAIYNIKNLTIVNTTFSSNSTGTNGLGGAIYTSNSGNTFNLTNGTLNNNQAGEGGAIYNANMTMNVANSFFSYNKAVLVGGRGGAIFNSATTIAATSNVSNSTFYNNTAYSGGAVDDYKLATLNLTNSTFLANWASNGGGAVVSNGSGVNIASSTFYNNISNDNTGHTLFNGTTLSLKNSIIALQTNPYTPAGTDCGGTAITYSGSNIHWPGNTCGLAGPSLTLVDPKIQTTLASNGGPTQTLALLVGSPAMNAASGCPVTDQRFAGRQGACDIGAYEYGGSVPAAPGVSLGFSPASASVGVNTTLTFTLHNPNALALTQVALSDILNPNLQIAANPNIQNTCSTPGMVTAGSGTGLVDIVGVSLGGGETCTIKVYLIGTKPGSFSTITEPTWAAETGLGTSSNQATMTVTAGSPATLSVTGGANQSATINTTFSIPLQALVKDNYGNPVSGVSVTFLAPGSNASAVFPNSSNTYSANTDASGLVAVVASANGIPGAYNVTASVAGANTALFDLNNATCGNTNQVVLTTDDGTGTVCGTLSFSLTHATANTIVSFDKNITQINVTGPLAAPIAGNISIIAPCSIDNITNRGVPTVMLAGQAVLGPGLTLTNGMTVSGIGITGFTGPNGYALNITGDNNLVYCSWLGTTDGVTSPNPNGGGIKITGNNNQIGNSLFYGGNLISGNAGIGIRVSSGTNNTSTGNWVGVAKDGFTPLKNSKGAIHIASGGQLKIGQDNKFKS